MNSFEAVYQTASCANPRDCQRFVGPDPFDAKHLVQRIKVRADWEDAKENVMFELVKEKCLNPKLARQLVDTNNEPILVENDEPYWNIGARFGCGENRLERILMDVREHLTQILSDR